MPPPPRPEDIIGEVLGEPAALMRNPANADYQCPFINGQCVKPGHVLDGPYPVCSIRQRTNPRLITVCPKRFLENDLMADVVAP